MQSKLRYIVLVMTCQVGTGPQPYVIGELFPPVRWRSHRHPRIRTQCLIIKSRSPTILERATSGLFIRWRRAFSTFVPAISDGPTHTSGLLLRSLSWFNSCELMCFFNGQCTYHAVVFSTRYELSVCRSCPKRKSQYNIPFATFRRVKLSPCHRTTRLHVFEELSYKC